MAPHNNSPAFNPHLYIQITGSCLGQGGPITVPRQSSLLTVQMSKCCPPPAPQSFQGSGTEAILAESGHLDSRTRDILDRVSLLGCWLSLLDKLIKNITTSYLQY